MLLSAQNGRRVRAGQVTQRHVGGQHRVRPDRPKAAPVDSGLAVQGVVEHAAAAGHAAVDDDPHSVAGRGQVVACVVNDGERLSSSLLVPRPPGAETRLDRGNARQGSGQHVYDALAKVYSNCQSGVKFQPTCACSTSCWLV